MRKALVSCMALLLAAGPLSAQDAGDEPAAAADAATAPAAGTPGPGGAASEPRSGLGMSILGNQEAPTSLVIVPWKSSQIGDGIGVSRALDTTIRPVDKDVFLRELRYYRIRASDGQ